MNVRNKNQHDNAEGTQAGEQAWEMYHEYDRFAVDTLLLNASDRMQYAITGGKNLTWTPKKHEATQNALHLLAARYGEIEPLFQEEYSAIRTLGMFEKAIRAVAEEWKTHYFYPRTEEIGIEAYNEWLLFRLQYADAAAKPTFQDYKQEKFVQCYRALAPLQSAILYYEPVKYLIVPPEIDVQGRDIETFRWDTVDAPLTSKESYILYPSTRRRLEAGLTRDRFEFFLGSQSLDDLEVALMRQQ